MMQNTMTFGQRLRQLRHLREMSLSDLRKASGVEKSYISLIENGRVNPPSARVIRVLSKALKTDVRALLLMAYVEKAPQEIRENLRKAVLV